MPETPDEARMEHPRQAIRPASRGQPPTPRGKDQELLADLLGLGSEEIAELRAVGVVG